MISPTCGSWIGARDLPDDPPRVGADRPAGGVLGAAACVGATVEAPARGALVDLPRPACDRLAQPVGVAAGVLHLVRERRAVDAAVGHPPGRQPGPAPAAELRPPCRRRAASRRTPARGRRPSSSCSSCVVAGAARSPARSRRRASPASRRVVAARSGRWRRHRRRRRQRLACAGRLVAPRRRRGGCSGSPTISRYSRAAASSRSRSPSGIQMTLRVQLVERARGRPRRARAPTRLAAGRAIGGVDDAVVRAGLQVDGAAGGEVAARRDARRQRSR